MATFDVAKLLNKITQDIPGINTVLKALAKWDVSALSDVPDGAMQATTDTNNRLTIKKKVSGSYTPVAKLMHDVDTVDGYHASTGATANTVAVRNASGALPGNITGNAATADTAVALAAGAVVPVNQGGTGATTASQARANLGAAGSSDFTAHIAKQSSSTVEGHVKLTDSTTTTSSTVAASATAVKAVNDSLGRVRVQGAASWSADSAPYPINAQVYHNGKQWLALRANSAKPVEGADWSAIGTAATANLTTSNTDGTAGRVLKVGDGGWMGRGRSQPTPLGYPSSLDDATNQTKVIGSDVLDNGVLGYATGIHFAVSGSWGRLRVYPAIPKAWIQGGQAHLNTGWTSQVVLSDNLLQTTGSSTVFPMSQKAVTDALVALGRPSVTGSATLNGTTNNTVQLTGIVTTLGLEDGDVIRIQYSGYNKLHSVESINNNNLIVVNYEHAGNRGNGSLRLANTTTNVTVTRIAKWYNAPIGMGQAWQNVAASRSMDTVYTNTTGRPIFVAAGDRQDSGGSHLGLRVGGILVSSTGQGGVGDKSGWVSGIVPAGSTYTVNKLGKGKDFSWWSELR